MSRRWREIREAALFETGRPVLLAPVETPPTLGRSVVIAWNGSTESARTIASAFRSWLPPNVSRSSSLRRGTPQRGSEVAAHLARQGISATSRTLKPDERPAGEVILDEAGDIGADLVLKGAFTRSRFRQVVFGGTTQHILGLRQDPRAAGAY